jgi:uncharacterized membrane protein YqjE
MMEHESATARANGRGIWNGDDYPHEEPSLGQLLKRLSADMGTLVSQEASLAKAELRESAATAAKGAAKLGIALTFAIAGTIALTAFLVIAIGGAIDNYWLAALIVGAAELLVGVVLARSAMSSMTGPSIKPRETIESLREDKQWVGQEARDLKRHVR